MRIHIRKGLTIPIGGAPEQRITDANDVSTVAVTATCINNLRPEMAVAVGDRVRIGQTLFTDKGIPEIRFTSPGAGKVVAVNRGARRALKSVVVHLEGDDAEQFTAYSTDDLATLDTQDVRQQLLKSGLWTTLRTRPFSHIPDPTTSPDAIFITAIDSNPLAADPAVIIAAAGDAFEHGLKVLARLADVKVYICTAADSNIPCPESQQFQSVEFQGPHPAGLVGTHIHHLHPVNAKSTVWHVSYHHVIAIGRLFTTGRLAVEKIISLAGPKALRPRLIRTRIGASTTELLQNETASGRLRIVSGSVLSGHQASGPLAYIGRYHNQISVLADGAEREFLAWLRPGFGRYSATRAYAGHVLRRDYDLTTSQNGSPRAMVSIGTFEKVMPLDILPTPLLKALLVQDTDRARELGCLELDEEDLSLCSFVCNGKYDYGPFLRANLDEIEANG